MKFLNDSASFLLETLRNEIMAADKIGGPVRVGARSGLGPIWALMGPYMGPCGPIWAFLDRSWRSWKIPYTFRKLSVETFGPISHVSGPKLAF